MSIFRLLQPWALVVALLLAGCALEEDEPDAVPVDEDPADDDPADDEADPADDEADLADDADPTAGDSGTRDHPVPLGESAAVGEWTIRVLDTTPDSTDEVLEHNQFNDPPAEGRQFFIARVEATYDGEDSATPWIALGLDAIDDSNVVYEFPDADCGVIPDSLSDRGEVFSGGSVDGNVCWSVDSDGIEGLVMIAEESFSFDDTRVFFALN